MPKWGTYRNFGLAERRRDVEVLGDYDVAEIVAVLHAPDGQPVDVVDRQRARKLYLYVGSLVALEGFERTQLVGNLKPK